MYPGDNPSWIIKVLGAFDSAWWVVAMVSVAVVLRLFVARPLQIGRRWLRIIQGALGVGAVITIALSIKGAPDQAQTRLLIICLVGGLAFLLAVCLDEEQARRHRAALLELMDSALIALLLVFCILRPFAIQAFYIPSESMTNTLLINDRILVNKFIYFFQEPRHNDIVVFRAPRWVSPDKKDFIKRVVGLPGDRVSVHDGKLWRNGQPIDEPFIRETPDYYWPEEGGEITVPEGSLLVMGDNRNFSNDSHKWDRPGPDGSRQPAPYLPRENVLGRAMVIFWPLTRISMLH